MSLLDRVFKLEQAQGAGSESGDCACHGVGNVDVRIAHEDDAEEMAEAERPPRRCDGCGRARQIVIVRLVRGWREP